MSRAKMQPFQSWHDSRGWLPRVGPPSATPAAQPWAELRNPFRIELRGNVPRAFAPSGRGLIKPRGENPEGIASFSPGLRDTSYPGLAPGEPPNPEKVVSRISRIALRLAAILLALPLASHAQLQLLSSNKPQHLFAGAADRVVVTWHNSGNVPLDLPVCTRLFQASSSTVAPLSEVPWKRLRVLPGQTVLESAALSFPAVKAETRFVIQWLDGTNDVVGTMDVLVYPPDLLKDLKPLLGEEPLGVFDPLNHLKPLLKAAKVEVDDLEDAGLERYHGKLAIIGPFATKAQMRETLANRSVKALAAKGVAVVWIQPPPDQRSELKPSFYTVPEGRGAVVVAQAELVAELGERPQAQLNLIRLARLALQPQPLQLPDLASSP